MRKKGFTLVELLVVIAIIGMLVGLLLPAVQQARESARVMQCNNNLKQLSLAAINHESTNKTFPSGGWMWTFVGNPDSGFGKGQAGAWTFSILPFMEQNTLFQMGSDGKQNAFSAEKKAAIQARLETPVPSFFCPSRRAPKAYPRISSQSYAESTTPKVSGKLDYAGNFGSDYPKSGVYNSGDVNYNNWRTAGPWWGLNSGEPDGLIYRGSTVKIAKIKDGTTNTYLIGEKFIQPSSYEAGTFTGDGGTAYDAACGVTIRTAYYSSCPPLADREGYDGSQLFGASHAGAFGMAMADGSVHRITYSIDGKTHSYLACRNDGEGASLPE